MSKRIFNYIKDNLEFDTLIWEFSNEDGSPKWVHVSYREGKNRNQILEAYKEPINNFTKYKIYEPREEKKETPKRDKGRSATSKVRSDK